jgi:hypothetical protein
MAKAILEFNLPEENGEFTNAVNGVKYLLALWKMDNHLRSELKHNGESYTEGEYKVLEDLREKLYEVMGENGVSLDELE